VAVLVPGPTRPDLPGQGVKVDQWSYTTLVDSTRRSTSNPICGFRLSHLFRGDVALNVSLATVTGGVAGHLAGGG
jgi:hypothetical protein